MTDNNQFLTESEAIEDSESAAPTGEKLQKVLARLGLGSRRTLEQWIKEGRISINGQVAHLGARVEARDSISVDGRPVKREELEQDIRRVLIYNKPEGEVCTRKDPEGRPTVFDRLPRPKAGRWINIGRLDINTSGLLLFTTDGELANRMMHPSFEMDREYAVRVRGEVTDEMIETLKEGVMLEDGKANFTDIQRAPGGEGFNRWFHCVVMEGRNREVRRLWESQGVVVSRLKRVRFGPVFLTSEIKQGRWRELTQAELNILSAEVGLEAVQLPEVSVKDKARQERQERKVSRPVHRARGTRRPEDEREVKRNTLERGRKGKEGNARPQPAERKNRADRGERKGEFSANQRYTIEPQRRLRPESEADVTPSRRPKTRR
ncbi:23S rRNA pseudouridine(2605) synthase RluB [Thiopseudomonas alkaliphila]|uniref:Pseudouridine synthase n=1 Tax=Thiopseudomonas alkaliphila TaxID=1697053 RepID=A0AAW7DUD6_9GAMM|nr:pseudouridine synthase [Thiopseudomonas alkaliphila]MDM1696311.1 pseudouridine synthase [Thiopseudomonas alkaliphila]MDM1715785.1 pseudouridine synthase [Thiopseudomonas alkaliphila]